MPRPMKMHEAAAKALRDLAKPTHVSALCRHMENCGYFDFGVKNPQNALAVCLDRHSSEPTLFRRTAPNTYALLEWSPHKTRKNERTRLAPQAAPTQAPA